METEQSQDYQDYQEYPEHQLNPFDHEYMGRAFETLLREVCIRPANRGLGFKDLNLYRHFPEGPKAGAVEVDCLFLTTKDLDSYGLMNAICQSIDQRLEPPLKQKRILPRYWSHSSIQIKKNSLIIIEIKKTFDELGQAKILNFERYERLKAHLKLKGVTFEGVFVIAIHNGKYRYLKEVEAIKSAHKFTIDSNLRNYPSITLLGDIFVPLHALYKSILGLDVSVSLLISEYVEKLLDIQILEGHLELARVTLKTYGDFLVTFRRPKRGRFT